MTDVVLWLMILVIGGALVYMQVSKKKPKQQALSQDRAPGGGKVSSHKENKPIFSATPNPPDRKSRGIGPEPSAQAKSDGFVPPRYLDPVQVGALEVVTGQSAGRRFTLAEGDNRIGRSTGNEIQLPDETVSGSHAVLRVSGEQTILFDAVSNNGTFVNGIKVQGPVPVQEGDQIRVGQVTLALVQQSVGGKGQQAHRSAAEPPSQPTVLTGAANAERASRTIVDAGPTPHAWLKVTDGPDAGRVVALTDGQVVIGREGGDRPLLLADGRASRRHAQVSVGPEGLMLKDLGSSNGTFVNGERIDQERFIKVGDRIRIGQNMIEVTGVAPSKDD